jgi:A/G-specific adenine glycosylase
MPQILTAADIRKFRSTVYSFFDEHARDLPWRHTTDPYHILVSEIMLQQTQVDRTILKFKEFIKAFPTARALSRAPLSRVLRVWQGMGYNRRAVNLQRCAQEISQRYHGVVPNTVEELEQLPGIGPYTARAIMAFAFDQPTVLIETNVRTVFLYHFFRKRRKVTDAALMPIIEVTLDVRHPRRWYSALMDYGSYLKRSMPNPSRRSAHHVKQPRFEGSLRQARGAVVKALLAGSPLTVHELRRSTGIDVGRIERAIKALKEEGVIMAQGRKYRMAE